MKKSLLFLFVLGFAFLGVVIWFTRHPPASTNLPSGNAKDNVNSQGSNPKNHLAPDRIVAGNSKRVTDFDTSAKLEQSLLPIAKANKRLRYFPKKTRDFLKELPKIKGIVDQGIQDVQGIELDIILDKHPTQDRDELVNDQAFVQSQKRVTELLTNLSPQIIAVEGFINNTITPEAQAREAYPADSRWEKVLGSPITPLQHYQEIAAYDFSVMADRAFLLTHPSIIGVGMEHEALYEIQMRWLDLHEAQNLHEEEQMDRGEETDQKMRSTIEQSFWYITYLRSEYAVAKLITEMKKRSLHRGVLVIGLFHGPDLIAFCETKGIKANFYHSCPTLCTEVSKEKILSPAY